MAKTKIQKRKCTVRKIQLRGVEHLLMLQHVFLKNLRGPLYLPLRTLCAIQAMFLNAIILLMMVSHMRKLANLQQPTPVRYLAKIHKKP